MAEAFDDRAASPVPEPMSDSGPTALEGAQEPRLPWAMFVGPATSTVGLGVSLPVVPLFAADMTRSTTIIRVVVGARGFARLLAKPGGIASEGWGTGRIFPLGAVLIAVSAVMTALSTTWPSLVTARLSEVSRSALNLTAAMALVAQLSKPSHEGRIWGHFQSSQRSDSWLGPLLGGTVAASLGHRAALCLFAAISAAAGVPSFLAAARDLRPAPRYIVHRASIRAQLRTDGASREFVFVRMVSFVVLLALIGAQFTAIPVFAIKGLALDTVGRALFAADGVGFAFVYPSALASDHLSHIGTILLVWAITAMGLAAMPLAYKAKGLCRPCALIGAGSPVRGPATQAYLVEAPNRRGLGASTVLFPSLGDVGSVTGPLVAGWLFGVRDAAFFLTNAAATVLVSVFFWIGTT